MPEDQPAAEESIASSAEYAKVHARIADILGDLRSQGGTATVQGAADEIQSMLPAPQVLVPLPPASKEAVESTIRIAKRIAEQAAYAHAAQANVRRGAVDQILSPRIEQGACESAKIIPKGLRATAVLSSERTAQ